MTTNQMKNRGRTLLALAVLVEELENHWDGDSCDLAEYIERFVKDSDVLHSCGLFAVMFGAPELLREAIADLRREHGLDETA